MFKSHEEYVKPRRLSKLLIAGSLGAASLGMAGCGTLKASVRAEDHNRLTEQTYGEDTLVITRQDCLEEYGNPNPFLGDAIVVNKNDGTFIQIEKSQIIDRGVVPMRLFDDGAIGLYDRFCASPGVNTQQLPPIQVTTV